MNMNGVPVSTADFIISLTISFTEITLFSIMKNNIRTNSIPFTITLFILFCIIIISIFIINEIARFTF